MLKKFWANWVLFEEVHKYTNLIHKMNEVITCILMILYSIVALNVAKCKAARVRKMEGVYIMADNPIRSHSTVERVVALLGNSLDFSDYRESFSPFYSDIGLGFGLSGGIENLFLHYNRVTTRIGPGFATLQKVPVKSENTVMGIKQIFLKGMAECAFYERNTWLLSSEDVGEISLSFQCENSGISESYSRIDEDSGVYILNKYIPNTDKRDPDSRCPLIIGIRVIKGDLDERDVSPLTLKVRPDFEGKILVAFSANMLDISEDKIIDLLLSSPSSVDEAEMLTFNWLKTALGNLDVFEGDEMEAGILAKAAISLLFNCCRAPGLLGGRVSCFPNRGTYPTQFLWDSCFQNMALEYMEPRLAEDSLLILTDNLRPDGKMGHFVCSTWVRPQETQPALVGWAGLRIVKQRKDSELAAKLLEPLCKNTEWWLTQRMTRFGIVSSLNPFETGWDNTPRFDKGPVLPCDINSYLLMQMRACEEFASMTGDLKLKSKIKKQADSFCKKVLENLYDAEENIFKDVLLETGEKLPIKSPACFMPLLADIPLEEDAAVRMIQKYLINPNKFFGNIPFPSVAYDEDEYKPDKWWRGPTWLPVAYSMLEILRKYGFEVEYKAASKRLYRMIIDDGRLSELFNSRTGEGIGSKQQGWSASILIKIKMDSIK